MENSVDLIKVTTIEYQVTVLGTSEMVLEG